MSAGTRELCLHSLKKSGVRFVGRFVLSTVVEPEKLRTYRRRTIRSEVGPKVFGFVLSDRPPVATTTQLL